MTILLMVCILIVLTKITDLGFLFVPSLDFHRNIDYIVSKSVHVLGFNRRHSSSFSFPNCLSVVYYALVRSILKYGAFFWAPYYIGDSLRVNKVQNRFSKLCWLQFKYILSTPRLSTYKWCLVSRFTCI